jgi:hypothetical protein
MKKLEIEVNGQKMWLDWDVNKAERDFMDQKEREYWEWCKTQPWYKEDSISGLVGDIRLLELDDTEETS